MDKWEISVIIFMVKHQICTVTLLIQNGIQQFIMIIVYSQVHYSAKC